MNAERNIEINAEMNAEMTAFPDSSWQLFLDACEEGDFGSVQQLWPHVRAHATQLRGEHDETPLMMAAESQSLQLVQFLVQDPLCELHAIDGNGETALIKACTRGRGDVVEYLLQQGSNVDCADVERATPLIAACIQSPYVDDRLEVVKLLLQYEAKVNMYDEHNRTALLEAVDNDREDIGEYLIMSNAAANIPTMNQETAACMIQEKGMMRLLELMRDPHPAVDQVTQIRWIENSSDFSPFHEAIQYSLGDSHVFLTAVAPIYSKILVNKLAMIQLGPHLRLLSPVAFAAYLGYRDIVRIFLSMSDCTEARRGRFLRLAIQQAQLRDLTRLHDQQQTNMNHLLP